jgi:hypothetical protein
VRTVQPIEITMLRKLMKTGETNALGASHPQTALLQQRDHLRAEDVQHR